MQIVLTLQTLWQGFQDLPEAQRPHMETTNLGKWNSESKPCLGGNLPLKNIFSHLPRVLDSFIPWILIYINEDS